MHEKVIEPRSDDYKEWKYYIWSWEHKMWWGPEERGYTSDLSKAGRYSFEDVCRITIPHFPPGEEVAVDEWYAGAIGKPPKQGCRQ